MVWLNEDFYLGNAARANDFPRWLGTMFRPKVDSVCQALRVYSPVHGSGNGHPDRIRLYNADTWTLMQDIDATLLTWPAGNTAGWCTVTLPEPSAVLAGVRYIVIYSIPVNTPWAFLADHPALPPGGSFLVEAVGPGGNIGAYTCYTNDLTLTGVGSLSFSAEFRTGADAFIGAETPSESATFGQQLSDWLSSDENTHHTGLPWLSKVILDKLDGISAGAISRLNEWNAATIGRLNQLSDDAIDTLNRASDYLAGNPTTGASAVKGADGTSAFDILTELRGTGATTADLDRLRDRLTLAGDFTDPLSGWTQIATETFTGPALTTQPAHMYRLNVTNVGEQQAIIALPDGYWYPRLGWWAPYRQGAYGQRGFIEFFVNDLRWHGMLIHGALFYLPPGVEYIVESWVRQ